VAEKPKNYNDKAQSIKVDPDTLWKDAMVTLPDQSKQVVGTLTSIATTWNNLKLSWYGGSAQEAADFNAKWLRVIDRLFGPDDPNAQVLPGEAILPKIAGAGGTAASNFGQAEDAVVKTFQGFVDAKPGPAGSARDHKTGPIHEHNTVKVPGA
jgi:hypothetical protein